MVEKLRIQNFKSIVDLALDLGRVNVFIGENGSGKSNVLEAVGFLSAGVSKKLDSEFLTSRGIRATEKRLMVSGFLENNAVRFDYSLEAMPSDKFETYIVRTNTDNWLTMGAPQDVFIAEVIKFLINTIGSQREISDSEIEQLLSNPIINKYLTLYPNLLETTFAELGIVKIGRKSHSKNVNLVDNISIETALSNFLIYQPENTSLRIFEKEGQIKPLGIHGEGLFNLIKEFSLEDGQPNLKKLNEHLKVFDWFGQFSMPERLFPGESYLQIKDKYLDEQIDFFDQKSANEGFLFLLFYFSLFLSKKTPGFFAIDNIETSLNPKLCTKLVIELAKLARENQKQVILTTHSPAILDGLNLNDDEQRIFLIYRNRKGHTVAKRVMKPEPVSGERPAKLSDLFMNGMLGGLPKNFSL